MGQRRSAPTSAAEVHPLRAVRGSDPVVRLVPLEDGAVDRLLGDLTHLLVSEGSLDRVLDAIADALREIVPHHTLRVYRADLPMRVLRPVLVRDRWSEEILAAGPFAFGQGIIGWTAETALPQIVDDMGHHPRATAIEGRPEGHESIISVPLIARDELKGVLCLQRRGAENAFDEEEFRRAVRFAGVAALAVDNAESRERLEAEVVTDHLTALFNHRHFHERMASELRRASLIRSAVSLVLYDIDDFSRLNASFGHLAGDQVLQAIAGATREVCQEDDIPCRVGGEEFAIILPGRTAEEAAVTANRLRELVATVAVTDERHVTISAGVAEGPAQATAARDLIACADAALREAKALGKDRVAVWSHPARSEEAALAPPRSGRARSAARLAARPADLALGDEVRSVAHLKMLQSLSQKLNRLNDVERIGETITAELRSLIDYHNCRIHLLQPDGDTLLPIAFRGELLEYQGETFDALVTKLGEGITGRVAVTGESFYTPNATTCDFSVLLPGTTDIDESILCVAMRVGDRVTGTVTLSKLGIDQFDGSDLRLLEVLASHAAVAFENARLFQTERESAEVSGSLLALSQALTQARDAESIWSIALAAIPSLIRSSAVQAWVQEGGRYRMVAHLGYGPERTDELADLSMPAEVIDPMLRSASEPFVIPTSALRRIPRRYRTFHPPRTTLVAPVRWEPRRFAAVVVVGLAPRHRFTQREMRLARGIADIASLAMGNAERYAELERTYLSTIEALANALEAQDEYTSDHARALAEMAITVGAELGLEGEGLKRLEISALFHDIGKIGVPSEIIRKPGPLTAEERRIMNRHPEIGEEILAPVPFLQPIRPIIRACHERWDGKGYPDGLARDGIPLEARIVFVCDAFHAMTTDRPYRSALPEGEAIRRMKLAAGTQFDPTVVAAFVGLHRAQKIHFHRH